jgi:hypothetical protein
MLILIDLQYFNSLNKHAQLDELSGFPHLGCILFYKIISTILLCTIAHYFVGFPTEVDISYSNKQVVLIIT